MPFRALNCLTRRRRPTYCHNAIEIFEEVASPKMVDGLGRGTMTNLPSKQTGNTGYVLFLAGTAALGGL